MRLLFLLPLVALLASAPAHAQLVGAIVPPPAPEGVAVFALEAAAPTAAPDTVTALHHLFARYRARRWRVAVGTLLIGAGLTTAPAVSANHANDGLEAGLDALGAIFMGTLTAVLVPVDFVALGRVSRRQEALAVAQWRAHQLPPAVRKALRNKDFAAPAR